VDYTNQQTSLGMPLKEAILLAGEKSSASDSHDFICTDCRIIPIAVGLNELPVREHPWDALIRRSDQFNPSDVIIVPAAYTYIERFRQFVDRIFSRSREQMLRYTTRRWGR